MGKLKKTPLIESYAVGGAGNATKLEPLTIDGESGKPVPAPLTKRRKHIRLRSIDDVRAQAEQVYRDARNGRIEPSEGTKLMYMLSQITTMIELGDLERRLAELENSQQLED